MFNNRKVILPTAEEDAAINHGIAEDPDTFELSTAQIAGLQPMEPARYRGGRKKLDNPKQLVSVRYDADIIEAFKAGGDGWQTRMNNALREWLLAHQAS